MKTPNIMTLNINDMKGLNSKIYFKFRILSYKGAKTKSKNYKHETN